jgi:hypothetical protein
MRKLILCSSFILALGVSAPALAAQASTAASANSVGSARAACDAKYYGYLVGRSLDEARAIEGVNYRLVSTAVARGDSNPKRMTIVYNPQSNQITEVACG